AHRRDRPFDVRHPAHQHRLYDDQPYRRHLSGAPAVANTNATELSPGRYSLPEPHTEIERRRPRDGSGDHDPQLGHTQSDPRRQGPPDLLRHADRAREIWHADL